MYKRQGFCDFDILCSQSDIAKVGCTGHNDECKIQGNRQNQQEEDHTWFKVVYGHSGNASNKGADKKKDYPHDGDGHADSQPYEAQQQKRAKLFRIAAFEGCLLYTSQQADFQKSNVHQGEGFNFFFGPAE